MNKMLAAKDICRQYKSGSRTIEVLRGAALEIDRREAMAIVGASGSGKSTLLHLLGALDQPDRGSILLDGVDYKTMNEMALARLRNRRVGFIYQFHHLLPEFSALENVMVPGIIQIGGAWGQVRRHMLSWLWNLVHPSAKSAIFADLKKKAERLLSEVGLEDRMTHRPAKLSGGEQQRVALARALINDPDLVLADEPTGNLDLATGDKMLEVILEQTVKRSKSLVMVTHNPDLASRIGNIRLLKDGILQ